MWGQVEWGCRAVNSEFPLIVESQAKRERETAQQGERSLAVVGVSASPFSSS